MEYPYKELLFGDDARVKIAGGINTLANAVRATIGPKGRNIMVGRLGIPPYSTNDGVTIAREIYLRDPYENMGALAIREAASKTNDIAGDGTTTSTIIAQALVNEGMKAIKNGADPVSAKNEIDKSVSEVIANLDTMRREVTTNDEVKNVATISAADSEVGELIADLVERLGNDAVITVEEGKTVGLTSEVSDGYQIESGFMSAYFVTDNERMQSIYTDVPVLLTDQIISNINDLVPVMQELVKNGEKQIVIVAQDIIGEAINSLILNHVKENFRVLAVKVPGGNQDARRDYLKDIAAVTGAEIRSLTSNRAVKDATIASLGRAVKVQATSRYTTFVSGESTKNLVFNRIKELESFKSDDAFVVERHRERVARLKSGVGVIRVGAATDIELKERKYRIEDAINAVRAAIDKKDGGILPGGGAALAKIVLKSNTPGAKMVQEAITRPLYYIATNAGKEGLEVVDKVQALPAEQGYNAKTDKYVDMFTEGIIDPYKVTVTALINAASVAGTVLTTEVIISPEVDPRP